MLVIGSELADSETSTKELERLVRRTLQELLAAEGVPLTKSARQRRIDQATDDILGFGRWSRCWPATTSVR